MCSASRSWRLLLLTIVGACTAEPGDDADVNARCTIGDLNGVAQLEIVHLDTNLEIVHTAPFDRVPLMQPPQGGWIVFLGVRATNVDGCRVDLTTSFRDVVSDTIIKVDRRPTLIDDTGDGWGITQTSQAGNLPICPQVSSTRDLHDESYEVTVEIDDAYGQRASQSMMIVPVCPDPDPTGRCLCECDQSYVVGAACP